jgi:serine/threonine protein phosphatase PrpC
MRDHKPNDPNERERIESAQGEFYDETKERISHNGIALTITRAMGNGMAFFTKDKVRIPKSHDPEITLYNVNENTRFLINCSDGIEFALPFIPYIAGKCLDTPEKIPNYIIIVESYCRRLMKVPIDNMIVSATDIKRIPEGKAIFSATFDGTLGAEVSEFMRDNFPRIFEEEIAKQQEKEKKEGQEVTQEVTQSEPPARSPSPIPGQSLVIPSSTTTTTNNQNSVL